MLIHICCSVDSHYFLRRIIEEYPKEKLVAFFYDPNIHPKSEFELRYLDVARSCEKLGIKLIKGEYEFLDWLKGAKYLENEPEGAKRCEFCFDFRLEKTALLAKSLGERIITTTLLMSPKKSYKKLVESLKNICEKYGDIEFVAPDFRKNGGTNKQFELAKKDKLYHQNYCGCSFALRTQKNLCSELFSPITQQILPNSIEEKIALYKQIYLLEKKECKFSLIREKFLNYRLLSAVLKANKIVINSYVLFYSHFSEKEIKFNIDKNCDEYRSQKDGVILISLKRFNLLIKQDYESIVKLSSNPPSIKDEIRVRNMLCVEFSLSPIIIVDNIFQADFALIGKSKIFEDFKEKICLD